MVICVDVACKGASSQVKGQVFINFQGMKIWNSNVS